MKKKQEAEYDGWTRNEFIDFLENTLIPDLYDSGNDATAEDFETALKFIKGA